KDVYHFPKGSYAILNNENREQWKTQSYFSLDTISPLSAKDIGFNEAKAELRSLVFDSVNLRLRSDVDVAFALSGGIDSSIITAVAAEIKKEGNTHSTQLKTFSSVFTTKEMEKYNEKEYIDAVLKKVNGLKPHFISPGDEGFVEGMDQLLYIQDEPYFSAGMYAQQAVFRLIHESGVKVSLDGQGVDEAIGGYSSYNSIYLHQLWKEKNPLFIREMAGFAFYYPDLFADLMKQQWSSHGSAAEIMGKTYCEAIQNQGMAHVSGYHQNCRFQIDRLFLPALLHHQDRNSMAYGVESRSPFLDYRIVEFFLALPVEYKIHNGKRKYILREAFKDVLPNEVYARYGKLGFPAPLAVWMKDNHTAFRALIQQACESGVADSAAVLAFDKQRQVGYKDYLKFIRLIYFDRWMKIYNVED
nr:asparagine synthase C-terminal domain-containing protein [Saprospiraceae bacterium]